MCPYLISGQCSLFVPENRSIEEKIGPKSISSHFLVKILKTFIYTWRMTSKFSLFYQSNLVGIRISCPEVFCKKGVLSNFEKFTGKRLCQSLLFNKVSLFFNKVAGHRPETLLKKRLWQRWFPENFAKFLRTPFLKKHVWWLLLRDKERFLFPRWKKLD